MESDYVLPNFESETFVVLYNPAHRWYYMKDQGQDDVLLIINFDSERDIRVPHSAFTLDDTESVPQARESFEIKVIVSDS